MKFKTGDNVKVMAGKDKGKSGAVIQVFPKENRLIVDGVNKMKKHLRKRGAQPGQRVEYFGPIHMSNVQMVAKGTQGRVGFKYLEREGKKIKVRVIKKNKKQQEIE